MIDINDAIHALSIYKAQEAGAFGDVPLNAVDAGVLGSTVTDVGKIAVKYMNGELSKEQAKTELDQTICTTIRTFVGNAISSGLDVVANIIAVKIPVIAPLVFAVKDYVKKPVIEAAKIASDWIYAKVKVGFSKVRDYFFG